MAIVDANLDLILATKAIEAMSYALARRSNLRVGVALLDDRDRIFMGANMETLWQRSFHGEEVAILNSKMSGAGKVVAICVAAERKLFTPCGACMDMIFEFGGENCIVSHVHPITKRRTSFKASEIMPYYPTRD